MNGISPTLDIQAAHPSSFGLGIDTFEKTAYPVAPSGSGVGALDIRAVHPQELSARDFMKLAEITQNMWAGESGLGELAQCNACGIISKEDVFSDLSPLDFSKNVADIMRQKGIRSIDCPHCGKDTRLIYPIADTLRNISERLFQSESSFVVVCRDAQENLVGYMDGYIAPLQTIYERELYHYSKIGLQTISDRVNAILGYEPPLLLSFSSMGLMDEYAKNASLGVIFRMLKEFARIIPDEKLGIPGITELDKNNNLYKIYEILGSRSLGISEIPGIGEQICQVGKKYKSDITVYVNPIMALREKFDGGIKSFVRKHMQRRGFKKEIH